MAAAAIIIFFVMVGAGVAFVAFSGGPGRAREAYLTGGRRFFRIVLPLIYLGIGIAVPAIVIANRHSAEGGVGTLRNHQGSAEVQEGKRLFRQTCASCHTLAAVGPRGGTGPNPAQIGPGPKRRGPKALRPAVPR